SQPPLLNLSPGEFLLNLTEHYLFAALHEMLYTSLKGENDRRIAHLDHAVQSLDDKTEEVNRRCNALRQEEIIEEIEVILLNSSVQDGRF
ncbi:MAG: ATPase, partial [Desulfuromonas sp.]